LATTSVTVREFAEAYQVRRNERPNNGHRNQTGTFASVFRKNERFQTATKKMIDKPANIRQDVFDRKLIITLQLWSLSAFLAGIETCPQFCSGVH
jgi:hypothetical protein